MNIHPTAIISDGASVHESCHIGPYTVIEDGVEVGPGCHIGPHVHIKGPTIFGANNKIHSGAVLGDDPQDFKFDGSPTRLVIGDGNTFREHVTIHRSNKDSEETVIGSANYFMAGSHVGHNSHVGNHNVLVNGALLAGHVQMADHCIVSGNAMVHQFVRIGSFSMMQGGAAISKDLPPFCIAAGVNLICGLNSVGLRRNGFSREERSELKDLYHFLFLNASPWQEKIPKAYHKFSEKPSIALLDFISSTSRGVCPHGRDRR